VSYVLAAGVEVEKLRAYDPAATTAINLTGNEFANKVVGNAGNNVIDGGGGADNLTGGLGADTFTFHAAGMGTSDATAASIMDFAHAQGDKIDISALDANILRGGDQHFTLHDSGADHVAGALWLVQHGDMTVVNLDTDGDGKADYMIHVTTQDATPLAASDFIF
jgi:serralysin